MKSRLTTVIILASLLVTSLAIQPVSAKPDYDLLIIAPSEFADELAPLKAFKDATGRPTVIVSLESIYANTAYDGYDTAEEIKKCIADYEDTHNVKYVLLVGDVDHLPMRYFYLKRMVPAEVRWLQYYLTDHYYADLYDSGGAFCSWDADGDHVYGEIFDDDDDGDYTNTDGIDFQFDVVVGRLPVDTGDEVERYVEKVIRYEKEVFFDDAWFKKILLVTGTGGWVYPSLPTTWDENENDAIATEMATAGFTAIKLYHSNSPGDTYPDSGNINDYLNDGVGFLNVISHGNELSWGVYDVSTDMGGLTNDDRLTVVYSFGCSTAKLGPVAPSDPYIGVSGTRINSPIGYPVAIGSWVEPETPDPLQDSTTDIDCMPEYWNFFSDDGAVAFIGSTAEASGVMGSPVMQYFYESFASDGHRVLGDVWDSVCGKVLSAYNPESDWDRGRRWLYINVFGDPTLVLGGLPDKPPETSLSIGSPSYTYSGDAFITGSTPLTLTAYDDNSVEDTYYRYYREGNSPPSYSTYSSPFTLSGADGTYNIQYYSVDDGGNSEYPVKTTQVVLDNSPPTTTLEIGSPKYLNTYVKSTTPFTLTASDGAGSGVDETYYRVDGGSWIPYAGAFTLSGEGSHTVEYYSVDNLGSTETWKTKTVIVDDTPPTTSLTLGSPNYMGTYVTSSTDIMLSSVDSGSGVATTEYRINGIWVPYLMPFNVAGSDGDYTIEYRSIDNLGNTEVTRSKTVTLDNTPPTTTMNIGDPNYVDGSDTYITSSTELSLSADDGAGSGVDATYYRVDGGSWNPYTVAFTLTGDGTHTVDYQSVDNLGNTELHASVELIIDDTPPEVNVIMPAEGAYVYDEITIEISAVDEGSGVHHVEYSLDGGSTWSTATYDSGLDTWLAEWDTAAYPEGTHTVMARAEDNVGNLGTDESPTTVTIVYLEYKATISHSDTNEIEEMIVGFAKHKQTEYKVYTNPGIICETITITNTGTLVTLPELILDASPPLEAGFLGAGMEAFRYQGGRPVHVKLNGADVTPHGTWVPDSANINVLQELAPGDTIEVQILYEYSFKGNTYIKSDALGWPGEDYIFEADLLSAYGPSWSSTITAAPIFH